MKIDVEVTEEELRKLVLARLQNTIEAPIDAKSVKIEVKTKQNFKAEWEEGKFRARISIDV
jgi:hypothetical protein